MKKLLVLGMVVIMALGVMVGCGSEQESSQVQPEAEVTEAVEAEQGDAVQDQGSDNLIGDDKAKEIALAEVEGATVEDIREFELDHDDGRWEYEGEIVKGEWEYEFEIDGESGKILKWEKDSIYD